MFRINLMLFHTHWANSNNFRNLVLKRAFFKYKNAGFQRNNLTVTPDEDT